METDEDEDENRPQTADVVWETYKGNKVKIERHKIDVTQKAD